MKPRYLAILILCLVIVGLGGLYIHKQTSTPKMDASKLGFDRPLIVGVTSWPGYAGGVLANRGFKENTESIYTKKYGLPVRFVLMEDIDVRGKAFAKGGPDGVDIVWSTVDFWANELPSFKENGVDARAFFQLDWSRGGDALIADASIKTIEDLRGKKLALVQYTPSHWLLEAALRTSSLTEKDRNAIRNNLVFSQDASSARAAFIAGQVDAVVTWQPDVTQALKREGAHILFSTKEYPELIADVMVAKKDFIDQHPQVLEAFVRGWFDGVEEAKQHPALAAKYLMENEPLFAELGATTTQESLTWVSLTDLKDNVRMFGLDGKPALFDTLYANSASVWSALGIITSPALPATDDSILRRIYQP